MEDGTERRTREKHRRDSTFEGGREGGTKGAPDTPELDSKLISPEISDDAVDCGHRKQESSKAGGRVPKTVVERGA